MFVSVESSGDRRRRILNELRDALETMAFVWDAAVPAGKRHPMALRCYRAAHYVADIIKKD